MNEAKTKLINTILEKGGLAKDVTDKTFATLTMLKSVLQKVESELRSAIHKEEPRITIQYKDRGTFEAEIKVAEDLLIFIMHTNAFAFNSSHQVFKSSYVASDQTRATVGMISVYNFLSDSFKFDRKNDTGQLVARIFVNKDGHFFAEGKRQLGVLFNDFSKMKTDEATMQSLVEHAITFSLDIDIDVPSFDVMKEITVFQAMVNTMQSTIITGKRLGFKFESDNSMEA